METHLPEKEQYTAALIVVDGHVIPKSPLETWKEGGQFLVDVPVMIGNIIMLVTSFTI